MGPSAVSQAEVGGTRQPKLFITTAALPGHEGPAEPGAAHTWRGFIPSLTGKGLQRLLPPGGLCPPGTSG